MWSYILTKLSQNCVSSHGSADYSSIENGNNLEGKVPGDPKQRRLNMELQRKPSVLQSQDTKTKFIML